LVVIGRGRIVAQGTKEELLAAAGTVVNSADNPRLAEALTRAGATVTAASGALHTDATTDVVGDIALSAGVALTELRGADGAGLEEMFLELTADSQRDELGTDLEGAA
jgi:ABC-2 type transport system ATP-binding protein